MSFLTTGPKAAIVAAMMSIVGAATAIAMLAALRRGGSTILEGSELGVVVVAAVGAFLAGLPLSCGFGRSGWLGMLIALTAAIAATALGAFLGGLLLFGTLGEAMICVVMVGSSIMQFPLVGLFWLTMMGMVHAVALVLVAKVPANLDLIPGPDDL